MIFVLKKMSKNEKWSSLKNSKNFMIELFECVTIFDIACRGHECNYFCISDSLEDNESIVQHS